MSSFEFVPANLAAFIAAHPDLCAAADAQATACRDTLAVIERQAHAATPETSTTTRAFLQQLAQLTLAHQQALVHALTDAAMAYAAERERAARGPALVRPSHPALLKGRHGR